MNHQYKLAVVGLESSVLIYRAIGADIFSVIDTHSAQEKVEALFGANRGDENRTPEYAVIFVEENFYAELSDDLIEKFSRKPLPAVVPVPSPSTTGKDFSAKRLSKIVERAIGSDIFN